MGLVYVSRWSLQVGEVWVWATGEEGLGQQMRSHVHTPRTLEARLRPMSPQEAWLDQGHDSHGDPLGDLRAMGRCL